MKQALEDYCREVEEKADILAREEERCRRDEHLRAYNLGRIAQRVNVSKREMWLRALWLLIGLGVGAAVGRAYPDYLYPALAQKFITKANVAMRSAGKDKIQTFWKNLRA